MRDKIIFWLDGTLIPFFVAHEFNKKNEFDLFAIIDITNRTKNFFQKQKLVHFQKQWYYHDHIDKSKKNLDMTFLSEFEEKYNIDLWKLAINERVFYKFNRIYKFSTEEIMSILFQECKLFESILDEVKPNFFISKAPPLHHHRLFYEICKAKGIQCLILNISRLGRKCIISPEVHLHDHFCKSLENIENKNRSFEDLQKYFKSSNYSGEVKKYTKKRSGSNLSKLKAAIEFFLISDNSNVETNYFYAGRSKLRVFLDAIKFSLRTKYRAKFINKNLLKKVDYSTPFVYFGLSVDAELNMLISSPFYTNQVENVRHVAQSLPMGYKLFVKEHPTQEIKGWRSISDYKEILGIPNVSLVHPSVSQEELIRNSSLVITANGTTGFDAAFYGKPSITFTYSGYSVLPSVETVTTLTDLPKVIRLSLKKIIKPSALDSYLSLFEKNSFDFDHFSFEVKENDYFFFDAFMLDTEIPESKMENFIQQNKVEIEKLSNEFEKKLKQFKKSKLSISE